MTLVDIVRTPPPETPHVLVATTCAPWKCNGVGELAWLDRAEERLMRAEDAGIRLTHFLAAEVDGRGMEPYDALEDRLCEVKAAADPAWDVVTWQFRVDDLIQEFDGRSRLHRICAGRNLAHEYAQSDFSISHILFIDTDTSVPADSVNRLLEVDHGIVCGHVPNYAHSGPKVPNPEYRDMDLQEHWTTAGFMMVRRDVFRKMRWRWDLQSGSTDDPCFQADAQEFGFGQTWVRHDVVGTHVEPLVGVEERDADRTYYR
jgi:hypothetical protein